MLDEAIDLLRRAEPKQWVHKQPRVRRARVVLEVVSGIVSLTQTDRKTLPERALKLSEETGELSRAVLAYARAHGMEYRRQEGANLLTPVVEEAIDVCLVAGSILVHVASEGVDVDDMARIATNKLAKWKKVTQGYPITDREGQDSGCTS